MAPRLSRRKIIQSFGCTVAATALTSKRGAVSARNAEWPPAAGPATPKICLGVRADPDATGMRRIKQIGVDYVLTGGPPIPWTEADVRDRITLFKTGGLTLCNMMIGGFPKTIYGRAGRDEEI